MKCIYCNSTENLTSSDIISYGITGAKLTKSFVCKKHNALTNDNYEKEFIAKLNFFRNGLGLQTRDGKPIQFKADLTVDGEKIQGVNVSDKKSIFDPKGVVAGTSTDGKKILLAPVEKLKKMKNGSIDILDISDVTLHATVSADDFAGFCALHSVAKIAYEWYCYLHNIEEYQDIYENIVNYILGENNEGMVDIVVDRNCYVAMNQLSEVGTNSVFEYDDADGYRYVVFNLWNMISYRVRIVLSPKIVKQDFCMIDLYQYRLDGDKDKKQFGLVPIDGKSGVNIKSIMPEQITAEIWRYFVHRSEKLLTTKVLTIRSLKKNVAMFEQDLEKYNQGKMDFAHLLKFEENGLVGVMETIDILYQHREHYDKSKSFNYNLAKCYEIEDDIFVYTPEEKKNLILKWAELDKAGTFYSLARSWIDNFNEIYNLEMVRV